MRILFKIYALGAADHYLAEVSAVWQARVGEGTAKSAAGQRAFSLGRLEHHPRLLGQKLTCHVAGLVAELELLLTGQTALLFDPAAGRVSANFGAVEPLQPNGLGRSVAIACSKRIAVSHARHFDHRPVNRCFSQGHAFEWPPGSVATDEKCDAQKDAK